MTAPEVEPEPGKGRAAIGWRHRLAHLFGTNRGHVETFWIGGRLMVGFRCSCGELRHVYESRVIKGPQ